MWATAGCFAPTLASAPPAPGAPGAPAGGDAASFGLEQQQQRA
jgi:hypothetical protein